MQTNEKQEHSLGRSIFVLIIALLAYGFACMDIGLFGVALPAVAKSMHITGPQGEYCISVGMVLCVIAGLFVGPLADRFGRRKTLQGVLLFTGIFSALTAFVGNYMQLIVVRALTGIGFDNLGPANTIVSEESIPKFRGLFMGILQAGYPLSMALAGTIAVFFLPDHWRTLFLIVFIPALVVIVIAFYVREPQAFEKIKESSQNEPKKFEWAELFKKQYRRQTWILLVYVFLVNSAIAAQLVYFVLYITTHNHIGLVMAAAMFGICGWIATASQVLVGILADYVPSKYFLIILPLAGSIGLFMLIGNGGYGYVLLAMLIYAIFGNGIWGCLSRYITESYPARIRATAITGIVGISDANYIIIPIIGGLLMAAGKPQWTMIIIGVATVISGLLMPFGKMIRPGQELSSIVED